MAFQASLRCSHWLAAQVNSSLRSSDKLALKTPISPPLLGMIEGINWNCTYCSLNQNLYKFRWFYAPHLSRWATQDGWGMSVEDCLSVASFWHRPTIWVAQGIPKECDSWVSCSLVTFLWTSIRKSLPVAALATYILGETEIFSTTIRLHTLCLLPPCPIMQ